MASSELGIYSTVLSARDGKVLLNRAAGHLVRTTVEGADEAAGSSRGAAVLSSPVATASAKISKAGSSWWPW